MVDRKGYYRESVADTRALSEMLWEYNGEVHSVAEWARIASLKPNLLINRYKQGWPIEKILTTRPHCLTDKKCPKD